MIDIEAKTAIDKKNGFNLLNPSLPEKPRLKSSKTKLNYKYHTNILKLCKLLLEDLKAALTCQKSKMHSKHVQWIDVVVAVWMHLEQLMAQDQLNQMGAEISKSYTTIFEPCPHSEELPKDVYCHIKLKDASKTITTWSYSSPWKYWDAWKTLIQSHEAAGRIRPSNSSSASPSFLVPKTDQAVLPHWVNDYQALNVDTVLDSYPLLHVDDILADCAKGKIWSKLDMINSFFQTWVHPDDIPLTAVTTPFGLYKWTVMPQGLKNGPPIHQRWMNSALCEHIGKFCHIYINDINIWSNSIDEHSIST